jgi:hypothetical protein
MTQMVKRRWKSKFARFVQAYGVISLARQLDVRPSAIYNWIQGRTIPRPVHALSILRLSRSRRHGLTMDQIYQHSRKVRADEIKLAPVTAPVLPFPAPAIAPVHQFRALVPRDVVDPLRVRTIAPEPGPIGIIRERRPAELPTPAVAEPVNVPDAEKALDALWVPLTHAHGFTRGKNDQPLRFAAFDPGRTSIA